MDVRAAELGGTESAPRPTWERTYASALPVLDAVLITLAALVVLRVQGSPLALQVEGLSDATLLTVLVPAWVLLLAARGCYDARLLGDGAEEYKRVLNSCGIFAGAVAVASYVLDARLPREVFLSLVPLAAALLLLGRNAGRRVLARARSRGRAMRPMLLVGSAVGVDELAAQVRAEPGAGYFVIGACVDTDGGSAVLAPRVTVLGGLSDAAEVATTRGASCVAVIGSTDLPRGFVRRLAWDLEGSGVDLMVAPAITDVAGPRIHVRPVANLALLHVEEPRFTGPQRLAKEGFDRVVAAALLLALLPVLLTIGIAIKVTSPGPVFFRQTRLGHGGREFRVWKFRSMRAGADAEKTLLLAQNESGGQLFKMRDDPRVTPVGRVIRRLSVDELPQLLNVLGGQMSLVGPRPLPEKLEQFAHHERRRLLVKPGITGLWQVKGRSDLGWDESVRLDLYYVENWSLALDLIIIIRTVAVVLRGSGAY